MDQARVEEIYNLLGTFVINLEDDPTTIGQRYIQQKVALCRKYLNETSKILLEVQKNIRDVTSQLRVEKSTFDIASDNIKATDEVVRKLPHVDDRNARVNVMLRPQLDTIMSLERDLEDLKMVEKAVRHRYDELKGTNTDIRTQRTTMRDELDTGAFYGDESEVKPLRKKSIDDDELDKIMQGDFGFDDIKIESNQAKTQLVEPSPVSQTIETSFDAAKLLEVINMDSLNLNSLGALHDETTVRQVASETEYETFIKRELPTEVPVSVKVPSLTDDDFAEIFGSI